MNRTPIEWTDFSANPLKYRDAAGNVVWACEKLSPGCANCYAEDLSHRYGGSRRAGDWNANTMATLMPFLDEAELRKMLTAKTVGGKAVSGSKCFPFDMTDLFGDWVPDELIDRVFAVFALRLDVTFQILTKRAERMRAYMTHPDRPTLIARQISEMPLKRPYTWESARSVIFGLKLSEEPPKSRWPLRNVWLGVSVENQRFADERIPLLLQTPAAVRFISAEPLLGPVSLEHVFIAERHYIKDALRRSNLEPPLVPDAKLDWVIVGGESGAGARPFDIAWARSIVQQCQAAGVPVFVKQLGASPIDSSMSQTCCDGKIHYRQPVGSERDREHRDQISRGAAPAYTVEPMRLDLRDRKGGTPEEWPADLRVREFPAERKGLRHA